MKIAYKHLIERIHSKPSIEDISDKLFQLGHEHEINDEIFDMEFTPNRGDCLSVNGILRDLAVFYDVCLYDERYEEKIESFDLDFINKACKDCPTISFLKIDLENYEIQPYKDELKDYFNDLDANKNNFFTDVSNYVSYETGQPTHCYDASKVEGNLSLNYVNGSYNFETLLGKKLDLKGKNLVFSCKDQIINLAGVIGGKNTSCSVDTSSVIVECAYFKPDAIIGKSLKYDLSSEAAHKFERNTDRNCHELVLRRFLKIVLKHSKVKNIEMVSYNYTEFNKNIIPINIDLINKIIGIKISKEEYTNYLSKLGFILTNLGVEVPSYRNDIRTQNDIAEEIARIIGYDNIPLTELKITNYEQKYGSNNEYKIKRLLIDNGFNEVINNPFVKDSCKTAIKIDNPLDSNKSFLRTNLKNSLIENLLFNERRQKDSIKLFELSDIYTYEKSINKKRVLGIIVSGRIGKNYIDFSKKLNEKYLLSILKKYVPEDKIVLDNVSRNSINSKLKTEIVFLQIELDDFNLDIQKYKELSTPPKIFKKYIPVSDFPSSSRDLSFSIEENSQLKTLENLILNYKNDLLKDCYVFDYYKNNKTQINKVGYRFIFQSQIKTITDEEVDTLIDDIISKCLKIKSVKLPGYKN
tara:strand:- start:4485 stop:6398 length:1914 start_codon:yes stop_codon:yes gene_type:complete